MTPEAEFQAGLARHRQGHLAEARTIYQAVLARNPNHGGAIGMLGAMALQRRDWDTAVTLLRRAVTLDPLSANDHANLGMGLYHQGEFDAAFESLQRAVTLDPKHADAWSNRGITLKALFRYDEAILSFDRAIALNPKLLTAHLNRATGLTDLKRHDESLAGFADALALDPDRAGTHWLLSASLLLVGEYEDGWWQYEWRKRLDPPFGKPDTVWPAWTGAEDLKGKHIFLHWEGGFGDTLQFCRYVPMVLERGAKVTIAVQTELVRLIETLDPRVRVLGGFTAPDFADYHCVMMSLPTVFGTTVDTIPSPGPYLRSDPARRAVWRTRLAALPGLRVGIAWSAGIPRQKLDRKLALTKRSIPLAELAGLVGVPGVSFVQLQKGLPPGPEREPPPGLVLHDWTDAMSDFAETAALVDELDLVISVDTAVAHVAGALGKPVWVMLWYNADWRWLEYRTDSPWYGSARLFRQPEMGAWKPVVQEVRAALDQLARGNQRAGHHPAPYTGQ